MTIYNLQGESIFEAPMTKNAIIKYALMGDYYIELSFNAASYINFAPGSYVLYRDRKFEIMDRVYPEFNNAAGGYKYTLQFQAQQNHLKRRKVFWLQGANREVTFHNTTTLGQFGKLIVDNMNEFLDANVWVVGGVPQDIKDTAKVVSFNGDSCWNALSTIAETFEVEWWTEENGDQVWLYFGKIEFGTPEEIKRGDVVNEIPYRRGDDANYGTRFYVFGASRNLPETYGQSEQGGTTNHVSEARLHLPDGMEYIDAKEGLSASEIIEQVAFFEDIYPKNTDTVTSVIPVQRAIEGADEDDPQTFTAYQVAADEMPFKPSDVIKGEKLMILFTSGSLTGMEFEADLRDNNDNRIDPETWKPSDGFNKKIEIVATTENAGDNVITIPNESLKPKVGDTFVLTGITLPEDRIAEAEQELLAAGRVWAQKNSADTSVFECPTNPVYCSKNDKNYEVGQKVVLIDPRFAGGSRQSRIQGYEKKLWNEYEATYSIGDNSAYTRLGNIESNVESAAYAERIGIVRGVGIYLIRSKYDMTAPTDYNAYSALATEALFLNKRKGGIVTGSTSFKSPVIGTIQSEDYIPGGFAGAGFKVGFDANGDTVIESDKLIIRKEAQFNTLSINQVSFTLGETVFSNGGAEITKVIPYSGFYRCYYDTKNGTRYAGIKKDDLVRCQYYSADFTKSKYYWRVCVGSSDTEGYFDLSTVNGEVAGEGVPEIGDNAVQFGNTSNKNRQSAIVIDPRNGGSVWVYANIDRLALGDNNLYVGIGTIAESQQAYIYGYGAAYFGDRNESSFIAYDPDKKAVIVKGTLKVGSGSTGLSNFSEWATAQKQISDAQDTANDAQQSANNAQSTANNAQQSANNALAEAKAYANSILKNLQDQLDGVVESFFGTNDPTIENEPANSWKENGTEKEHVNDTYTNTESGRSWRWSLVGGDYQWVEISDTAAAKALDIAQKAQDTADGKRRTFIRNPYGPYDVGDLWISGEQIKVCKTSSQIKDYFAEGDWINADDYYEKINEAQQEAEKNANEYSDRKAQEAAKALNDFIKGDFADEIGDIKGQIDGKAETFYEGIDPSTSWNSDVLKEQHKGDLWYTKGRSYTWDGSGWVESNVPESVYDQIDGKAQIFVEKPSAYHKNDMWVLEKDYTTDANNKEFVQGRVVFAVANMEDWFKWSDWDLKLTYTDDTTANNALEKAEAAQKAADDAIADAAAAQARMDGWVADGVITQMEKQAIKNELAFIGQDFTSIRQQAIAYGNESIATAMAPSYVGYETFLKAIVNNTAEVMDIPNGFVDAQSDYYAARTTALQEIAELAKSLIDAVDKKVDDYSYLKNALDKTDSNEGIVIDNGLILSSIIGVRRNEKVVAAMMNAENINNQADVPYFAAGIKNIQDIAGSSRFLVSYDGKVQVQDNEVEETTRRKVIMDFGALRYFNGEAVALEQIPDEYKATPTADMAFGNITKNDVRDETYTFTQNIIVSPPAGGTKAKRSLVSFDVGADYDEILISGGVRSYIDVLNATSNDYKVQLSLVVGDKTIWTGDEIEIGKQISSGIPKEQILWIGSTVSGIDNLKGKVVKLEMSVWKTSGSDSGTVSFSFGSKNTVVVKGNVSISAYANRLFGNGFFFAKTAENYCGVIVDGDNGAVAEMRNGNQGFRFTENGPQKYHKDFGWIPIDGVIARGTVTYSASWSTPSINILSSVFRSAISVTTGGNRTIVTMPSNENLTTSNWVVTVNGEKQYSSSSTTLGVFASVVARSANQFTVYTGANNSAICGNFSFEIKAI